MRPTSPSPDGPLLVVGAGPMAQEHVRVLLALGVPTDGIVVVGRGAERVERLTGTYGVAGRHGGLDPARDAEGVAAAVVAIREDAAADAALALVEAGVPAVLVEKPGALAPGPLQALDRAAGERGALVAVGYNRRFYPSTTRARELVAADGGALSCSFDFTEVERLVLADRERRGLPDDLLARWGLLNSLHVVDLAFHLAGRPTTIACARSGSLPWHPAGAVFSGQGTTESGAAFVYLATWSGAGRWGVEVATSHRKLVLRPLEELRQQLAGSFALEPVALEAAGDLKPGLADQLAAFLAAAAGGERDDRLCTAADAAALVELGTEIFCYA